MPIAKVKMPDGRIARLEVPEGTTQDQVMSFVEANSQNFGGARDSMSTAQNEKLDQITDNGSRAPSVMEMQEFVRVDDEPEVGAARTALEQGLQGATFGFGDEVTNRMAAGLAALLTESGYGEALEEITQMTKERLAKQQEQRPGLSAASNVVGALTTGLAGGATKAGSALARGISSGGLGSRIGKGAAAGAGSAGLYGAGQAQEGERIEGALEAAPAGAALGAVIPAAGEAVRGVVLPKVSESIQPLAKRAQYFGIPLSISQVAPGAARNTVQKISEKIPGSGVGGFQDKQTNAFMKAVAKTIGQDADNLKPSVIKQFRRDADKKFGNAVIGKAMPIDTNDINALQAINREAELTLGSNLQSIVDKNVKQTIKDLGSGNIMGSKLTSMRSSLIKKLPKVEGEAKQYVGDIIEVIDDIAERNVSPSKVKMLKQARREYRNYKTIEPLLEKSSDGTFNPALLSNKVAQNKYIKAAESEIGEDDLVDLGRIGKEFLPKLGGSDTFEKAMYGGGAIGLGAGAGDIATTGGMALGVAGGNRLMQVLNQLNPRVAAAVEKGGERFIPQSMIPAILAGLAASEATSD